MERVLLWGAASVERCRREHHRAAYSAHCLQDRHASAISPSLPLDPTVQSRTLSNDPRLLGITDLRITMASSSGASLEVSGQIFQPPWPYSQITPRSHTSKLHLCSYVALLNRCLLVTSFLIFCISVSLEAHTLPTDTVITPARREAARFVSAL